MKIRLILLLTAIVLISLASNGQRRITPISNPSTVTQSKNENHNPDSLDRTNIVEMTDAAGRTILVDTITGTEVIDSTAINIVPAMTYPFAYSASVGVNVWDPIMRVFGQKYGLVEFNAEFNMHNRYIPVVEVGLGEANIKPDDNNFTYKSAFAPYFRVGMNYNFLYNSNPSYMAMAGVRYGFSPYSFSITDVTVDSPYWKEEEPMNLPSQKVTTGYFEILFNLRLRISGPIYVGWTFKYHTVIHDSPMPNGKSLYIPGFGKRSSPISGAITVTYTFEFDKDKKRSNRLRNNINQLPIEDFPAELPPIVDPGAELEPIGEPMTFNR